MPRRRVSRFLSTAPGCALPPMRSKVTAVLAVTLLGLLAGEVGALAGITSIRDEAPAHDGAQSNGGDDAPPALPDWATKIPDVDYSVAFMDLHEPEKEVSESESKFRPHDGLTDG